jgi:hypothetical protein
MSEKTHGKVVLQEKRVDGGTDKTVEVKVVSRYHPSGSSLFIEPEGYGDCFSSPGRGVPIVIEVFEGNLQLVVWADINSEDPTHTINLEGAREEKRKDE